MMSAAATGGLLSDIAGNVRVGVGKALTPRPCRRQNSGGGRVEGRPDLGCGCDEEQGEIETPWLLASAGRGTETDFALGRNWADDDGLSPNPLPPPLPPSLPPSPSPSLSLSLSLSLPSSTDGSIIPAGIGLTTMGAAATGNLLSDIAGIALGGTIQTYSAWYRGGLVCKADRLCVSLNSRLESNKEEEEEEGRWQRSQASGRAPAKGS